MLGKEGMKMTGKEALEKLLDTLKHWQGRNTIFDKMQGDCILKELDELTKYKRAFEILEDKLNLEVMYDELDDEEPYLYTTCGKTINMEEYELLEELMRDE